MCDLDLATYKMFELKGIENNRARGLPANAYMRCYVWLLKSYAKKNLVKQFYSFLFQMKKPRTLPTVINSRSGLLLGFGPFKTSGS